MVDPCAQHGKAFTLTGICTGKYGIPALDKLWIMLPFGSWGIWAVYTHYSRVDQSVLLSIILQVWTLASLFFSRCVKCKCNLLKHEHQQNCWLRIAHSCLWLYSFFFFSGLPGQMLCMLNYPAYAGLCVHVSHVFVLTNIFRPLKKSCCESNWIYWYDDRLLIG